MPYSFNEILTLTLLCLHTKMIIPSRLKKNLISFDDLQGPLLRSHPILPLSSPTNFQPAYPFFCSSLGYCSCEPKSLALDLFLFSFYVHSQKFSSTGAFFSSNSYSVALAPLPDYHITVLTSLLWDPKKPYAFRCLPAFVYHFPLKNKHLGSVQYFVYID